MTPGRLLLEERETRPDWRRGVRKGQLRYYLRRTRRDLRYQGVKFALTGFWAARWFWSCGRLGPVPHNYSREYWT